jgi:hypothetical protein
MTAEMAELAEKLATPLEVYKYVYNTVNTEFYYGSRKGAIGTYEQNGGNDFDQSSLLIAMLHYLGYEADYYPADVIFTDYMLYNMTATSDIEAAENIFTSQGKKLEQVAPGEYKTQHILVSLSLEGKQYPLDPSFKYYKLRDNSADLKKIMSDLESQYDVNSENPLTVSANIENSFGEQAAADIFPIREISNPKVDTLPTGVKYDIVAERQITTNDLDAVELQIGNFKLPALSSSYLYGKDLTVEYELTPDAKFALDEVYGFDINSIDDLTGRLGTYANLAQIYAVIKLDGVKIANGNSNLLGTKENLKINVRSGGGVQSYEKELAYGGLYSIVFDYGIISPQDIAASYSKLPQNAAEQAKTNASNVFGSPWLMDAMSLIGKSYFSQMDTNNAMTAEFSAVHYGRSLSVAVVDFIPDIYTQAGETMLNKQGKMSIDVLGNQTVFTSRENSREDETKLRHSAGFLSSYYESETLKQFSGQDAVSTAEVLNRSAEQGIDLLYLSSANISELGNSKLSEQNKADITAAINEGKYVTVPNEEITVGSWSGTGWIEYDPATDTNAYIINNNLNGGSWISWVTLALIADFLLTMVEFSWAFDLISLGADIFAAGLFTGNPLIMLIGLGIIVAGGFYLCDIGNRFYESTELMTRYLDGDMAAGEELKWRAAAHGAVVGGGYVAGKALSKPIGKLVNKIHLEEKVGRYVANAFAKTPGGYTQAVDILNRISPKQTKTFTELVSKYGDDFASAITKVDDAVGKKGVEDAVDKVDDAVKKAENAGVSPENTSKMAKNSAEASAKGSKFTEPTLPEGGKPKGKYATVNPLEKIENQNALKAQNRAADVLANKGYDITMLPDTIGGNGYGIKSTSSPDFLIDGQPFDCYSPSTDNLYTIYRTIEKKTEEQAARIVINLDNYTGTVDSMVQEFFDYSVEGLQELFIIKSEEVIRIFIR